MFGSGGAGGGGIPTGGASQAARQEGAFNGLTSSLSGASSITPGMTNLFGSTPSKLSGGGLSSGSLVFGTSSNSNTTAPAKPVANASATVGTAGSLFSSTGTGTPHPSSVLSGSLFGAASQSQTGGLFGSSSQGQTTGGIFGASQSQTTGGLFSTSSQGQTSGSLFGATAQSQQTGSLLSAGASLFGANSSGSQTPSGSSLIGSGTAPSGLANSAAGTASLSSALTASQAAPSSSSSLFGSSLAATSSSTIGGTPGAVVAGPGVNAVQSSHSALSSTAPGFGLQSQSKVPPSGGSHSGISAALNTADLTKGGAQSSSTLGASLTGRQMGSQTDAATENASLVSRAAGISSGAADRGPLSKTGGASHVTPTPQEAALAMIQHERVDELLSNWEVRLQRQVRKFNAYAQEVAAVEKSLIVQAHQLNNLRVEQGAVARRQQYVAETIQTIEGQQQDLLQLLNSVEAALRSKLPPECQRTSESTMVELMSHQLQSLNEQMDELSVCLNSSAERLYPGPLSAISQILALHQTTLQACWDQADVLEKRVELLHQQYES